MDKIGVTMSYLRQALVLFLWLTLVTGVIYPAAVTMLSQTFMASQANGSLIVQDGITRGSSLIGQGFSKPKYFWSRPSATAPNAYNAALSSGSNLSQTNPNLLRNIEERLRRYHRTDSTAKIPVDLITSSASGLDPHISPAGAYFQIQRVAQARNLPYAKVKALVDKFTELRAAGLIGEPRVNVLLLNLALDKENNLISK
jgi:potassium-transporting ATPase KdpC subunit